LGEERSESGNGSGTKGVNYLQKFGEVATFEIQKGEIAVLIIFFM
jgi:hypothetical protein